MRAKVLFCGHGFYCDEANIANQIIERNYFRLFLPLKNLQVAPPIFLVLSKFMYSFVKLHYTPYFSDILLRTIPFLSGIIAIPAFGYLVKLLLNNRFAVLAGMTIISLNPVCISWSALFKQYSLEMLVTILMLIIFYKIDFSHKKLKYNLTLFILLGLMPLFSMTAVFIFPGGFLYVLLKNWKKENFKSLGICFAVFFLLFFAYVFLFLIPVSKAHYTGMIHYWQKFVDIKLKQGFIYYYGSTFYKLFRDKTSLPAVFFILSCILGLFKLYKNREKMVLVLIPIIVTNIFILFGSYPFAERLLLFIFPCITVILLYPITIFRFFNTYFKLCAILLLIFISLILYKRSNLYYYTIHSKFEPSREAWEYLSKTYQNDGVILFGSSVSTNRYYYPLYLDNNNIETKIIKYKEQDWQDDLDSGIYYLIVTRKHLMNLENFLQKQNIEVFEKKDFQSVDCFKRIRESAVIKFRKF